STDVPEPVPLGGIAPPAHPVLPEEDHAVAHLPRRVGKAPATVRVELDEALHPARPVEIDPLIREPEVGLDDRPADRLEVHEPRVSGEVAAEPLATVRLERRQRLRLHGPVVEGPVAGGPTGRVA